MAAFYAGPEGALGACLGFVREAVQQQEPVLVALAPERNEALHEALDLDTDLVQYADMRELGGNPARIIPRWQQFLEETESGGPVRGIGEPAWAGRGADDYVEAALHESLLNVAFDGGRPWRLMCPYDLTALPVEVLEEARRTHPGVRNDDRTEDGYAGHGHAERIFTTPLPAVPADATGVDFEGPDLGAVRGLVVRLAQASGLPAAESEDLALAVHELTTNSVRHGGGHGAIYFWDEPDSVVVEVRDDGRIDDPLVGRRLPSPMAEDGRGVWIANQLCDLVQTRSGEQGTQVRLRMQL